VLFIDEANGGGLDVHGFSDDLHGSLQHLRQIARLGEHGGDVVNRGQLVDPLAKLIFLITKPRDCVGEQKEKLDRGRARVFAAKQTLGDSFNLLHVDVVFL
jgi:hypothetical protein